MSARLHALVLFVVVSSFLSAGPSIGRAAFTPAALVSITPNRGQQGQTITVAITARDTQFVPGVTEAKFGDGISVGGGDEGDFGPLTVTSPTRATAQITIADDADLDGHNVVVRTRQERIPLKDAFTVTPAPVRMTVTPDRGRQGETLTVTITGQNTHFQNGVTEANFGDDISTGGEDAGGFGPVVVSSPTRATVQIHIESDAGASERKVVVRTRQERLTLRDGFTVLPAPPQFTLSQNSARQGETLTITIDGANTQFRQGITEVRFGAGISVGDGRPGAYGPVTVNSPTRATARIVIDNDADTDARTVRIRTGDEKLSITDAFNVIPSATPVTVVPNSGARGQTLTVSITSPDAHFVQGETEARFGPGIEVGDEAGFGPVTVLSGTQAMAQLSIRSRAKPGARKVAVRTGKERFLLKEGFHVVASPITITLAPATGQQGQKLTVQITGTNTHFAQGTTQIGLGLGIILSNVSVSNATSLTALATIAASADLGTRTLTVTTGSEAVSLNNAFTVTAGTPVLQTVNPNTGQQGQQNLNVNLTGQFTHFVQGTTTASFGAGITVASLTVNSATAASAVLNIDPNAATGTRNVTLTTGAEVVTLNNGFAVTSGTPVLQTVDPNTGQQGQQNLSVNLAGQFTHFVQGTTTANFGAGITVASLTVNSATAASAVLNIDPTAATGTRNVTLTTGAEVVTLNNGFTVTAGTLVLQTVDPNTGQQGQQNLNVNLTGQFTHFVQGTTTANFGAGITVATLTVNSATAASAALNIDPAASTGPRNVTLTTGAEAVTLNNGFTVTVGTLVLQTVNPNTGQQGQQNLSVNLTGQFTHFVQGTTTASFGAGITVASLTVSSATTATAVLNIDPTAATGTRNVTLTTGAEVVTLNDGFTVTVGTLVLQTVNPNTGQQGQQNLSVNLTGQFTHFVQGTTTASFGAGITVASLTVNSAATAAAVLNIDPAAAIGTRNVTLTTGAEVVTLNNGFTVTAGTPVLQTVNPNTGQQGQQNLSVNLTGQFTHFVQGTTTASFAAGITVASLTVNSSTKATAVLNIDPAAAIGLRGVTLITGAELVTLNTGFTVTAGVPLPVLQPPAVDKSVTTDLGTATEFLYTGSNPVQTGVAAGTISKTRAAVIRGKVMSRDGAVLPGVQITILNHPEFGQTLSRADGMFDMAVNGGGPLTLNYAKAGLISAQRQLNVPWKDFALAPDVVMIPFDTRSTFIDASSFPGSTLTPIQVARGTPMTDSDGTRQATLMFQAGTTATMVMPDGSMTALTGLTVRATEYTVGANGPQAMPADLPPTSAYTYAVEFSVDEAKAAGAIDVRFSSPLPFYAENFLGFPVGTVVPLGSYSRAGGVWIPSESGLVLKILSVTNGLANLDTNGDGIADSSAALAAFSISDDERRQLAALYPPGQTLWRVLIPHFDQPWDANWGVRPPDNAVAPRQDPRIRKDRDDACETAGSVIECQNQILGEALGVVGTQFTLHYQSERVPGRNIAYKVEIPLSEAKLPDGLLRIELEVRVAGQFHKQTFPAAPNQSTSFTWNGEDAYGRVVQGQQPITVRIGYTYPSEYGGTARFGHDAGDAITGSRTRNEITMFRTWRDLVGSFDERGIGLGGWTLSPQHTYIPLDKLVYRGDGGRQTARTMPPTISTAAGTGNGCGLPIDGGLAIETPICPEGLAFGPDGSLYIAQVSTGVVRRVSPDGIVTTVAGNGLPCTAADEPCGDGGPARQARINGPWALAVGADGSLYISEVGSGRPSVRRVAPDGTISTFAGTRAFGFGGDGGPARLAQFSVSLLSLAVGPDGSLYILDQGNVRIRRVSPDGIVDTVAGTGISGFSGDGGPAVRARLVDPRGIAVGADGSLYIADNVRLRRVTPDGVIRTIAGTGQSGFGGDGGPATEARLGALTAVAVAPDDTVYIVDSEFRIRWMRLGGTINTLAGTIESGTSGDGGPARQAKLQNLDSGLAVGPDGAVYVSQTVNNVRVRRISPVLDALLASNGNGYLVPGTDGSEVDLFNLSGRHLRTVDTLTGVVRYQFAYDSAGRLISITDRNGNVTTIEHDGSGNPTAIVGPFGQRTLLAVNADGYLNRVTSPAGEAVQATYTSTGLLTSLTNPRGQTTSYTFDADGFLTSATDPTGATKSFAHSGTNSDYTVTMTTALGRTTTHRVQEFDNGDVRQTTTDPSGAQNVAFIGGDGIHTVTSADGTTVKTVLAPDPRWSMLAPVVASQTVTMPSGLVRTMTSQRTVTLGTLNDPLSLRTETDTLSLNGRVFTAVFDALSRTVTSTSAAGRRSTAVLDDRARLVQKQFGDLAPVTYTYDARGRLAAVMQGGRVTSFTYGSDGFLASQTDPSGRTMAFARDADVRVTAGTLADGRVVRFTYDLNGNLTAFTPPGRPEHTFSYTPRDEVATYSPPLLGAENDQEQFGYNADRQPLRQDRPDGQAVQFQYDTAGRLNLLGLVSGSSSYSYDGASRLTSLTVPLETMTYTYDGGLSTGSMWSGAIAGVVTRTFDSDSHVASHSVNGSNPVTIQYDADSLRTQVGALSLARSPQTGLLTTTALGALSDRRSFDTFGDLVAYTASHGGTTVYALDLTRDALGRIIGKTETLGATHVFGYTYDLAGRLTEVFRDGLLTDSYTYDANDSRLTGPQPATIYSYDSQDRLAQRSGPGTQNYSYTPNGERRSKTVPGQTTTYRYDSLGHLIGVSLPGGTQIDYVLDGADRRVGKRINGALVQGFLYQDALRPIAELDAAGNVVSRFVYAERANLPAYLVKNGTAYRIITDQLGSPRLVIDSATGSVAQQLDYDAFGNVLIDTNPGFQPFGFAGGLYDPLTGLVHFGAREYDPETGRWTTKDGFDGGPNLYIYADNDPVNLIDPLGNQVNPFESTPMGTVVSSGDANIGWAAEANAWRWWWQIGDENRNFFSSPEAQNFNGSIFSDRRIPFGTNQLSGEIGGDVSISLARPVSRAGPMCRLGGPLAAAGYWLPRGVAALEGDYSDDEFKTDLAFLALPVIGLPAAAVGWLGSTDDPVGGFKNFAKRNVEATIGTDLSWTGVGVKVLAGPFAAPINFIRSIW